MYVYRHVENRVEIIRRLLQAPAINLHRKFFLASTVRDWQVWPLLKAVSCLGLSDVVEMMLEHPQIEPSLHHQKCDAHGMSVPLILYTYYSLVEQAVRANPTCTNSEWQKFFPRVLNKATRDARALAVVLGVAFNQPCKMSGMNKVFKTITNTIVSDFLTYLQPAGKCQICIEKEQMCAKPDCKAKYIDATMIGTVINNSVMVLPQNKLYSLECLQALEIS